MNWLFSEEHITLDKKDIEKVNDFFKKEFGITNITKIKATVNSFEIVRLCTDQNDSLASAINNERLMKSVNAFNEFCKRYGKGINIEE